MRRTVIPLLLAVLLTGATSCRPQPVRPPDLRPLPTPKAALAHLQAGGGERQTMRSLGRVTYFGKKGRIRLRAVVVVERPGRFRLETLSPLEQPIDVMTSDGARIWLLSGGKLYEGPATPENMARVVPVPLRPEDLVDAMLGGVPTGARFRPVAIAWAEDDHYRLTLEGPRGERADLLIDPKQNRVDGLRVHRPDGAERLRVAFDKFKALPDGNGAFARRIKLSIPEQDHEVTVRLNDVDVNVPINPALFVIEPPPGMTAERLDSPPAPAGQ